MEKDQIQKIYKEYVNEIFRYSMFKLKNRQQAEDVTSEVFTRLLEREELSDVENIKVFLIGIARNVVYEKYRKESRININNLDEDLEETIPEIDINIEKTVMEESMLDSIKKELDKLDEDTKEVISLRIWDELQFNEIAKIGNVKESTAKLRFYRGIEKLKLNLNQGSNQYSFAAPSILYGIFLTSKSAEFSASTAFITSLGTSITSGFIAGAAAPKSLFSSILIKFGLGATTITLTTVASVGLVTFINEDDGNNNNTNTLVDNSKDIVSYPKSLVIDKSNWNGYRILNSDGTAVEFKYPSYLQIKTFNDNSTYAFVAEDGSAFGYDFGQGDDIDCGENRAEVIEGGAIKFKRFFDDTVAPTTNWFVCEFKDGKFVLNTANQFTLNALAEKDLLIFDEILKTVTRSTTNLDELVSFASSRYDISFKYPKDLGALNLTFRQSYFQNEAVSFSNSPIVVTYTRFEGAGFSPDSLDNFEVVSQDGKVFKSFTFPQGVDGQSRGIIAQSYSDGKSVTIIAQNLSPEQVDDVNADIRVIIESMSFDFSSVNLESLFNNSSEFSSKIFKLRFNYSSTFGNENSSLRSKQKCEIEYTSFDKSGLQVWIYKRNIFETKTCGLESDIYQDTGKLEESYQTINKTDIINVYRYSTSNSNDNVYLITNDYFDTDSSEIAYTYFIKLTVESDNQFILNEILSSVNTQ